MFRLKRNVERKRVGTRLGVLNKVLDSQAAELRSEMRALLLFAAINATVCIGAVTAVILLDRHSTEHHPIYRYKSIKGGVFKCLVVGERCFLSIPYENDRINAVPVPFQTIDGSMITWAEEFSVSSMEEGENPWEDRGRIPGGRIVGIRSGGKHSHSIYFTILDDPQLENQVVSLEVQSTRKGRSVESFRITPRVDAQARDRATVWKLTLGTVFVFAAIFAFASCSEVLKVMGKRRRIRAR